MPVTAPHLRDALADAVGAALFTEAGGSAKVRYQLEPTTFLAAIRRHRVSTLIAQQGSAIGLPDEVVSPLKALARKVAMRSLHQARSTLSVMTALADAQVDALTFKGIALSLQTTSVLHARQSVDVDILVRPSDMPRAHEALVAGGFTPRMRTYPTEGAVWRHVRWVTRELPYAREDCSVDLHWRVAPGHGLFPDSDRLLSRAELLPLGDSQLRTLSLGDACAAVCLHAYVDGYNHLRYLVDLHRLLRLKPQPWPDWHPRLRHLMADTLTFAEELVPYWPSQGRAQLGLQQIRPRTQYARQLWNARAGTEVVEFIEMTPQYYVRHHRHTTRYAARRASATGQVLSEIALAWQDMDPRSGARGFAHGSWVKLERLRARLGR
jgi:Uncharacterised nucleotidyltransferase